MKINSYYFVVEYSGNISDYRSAPQVYKKWKDSTNFTETVAKALENWKVNKKNMGKELQEKINKEVNPKSDEVLIFISPPTKSESSDLFIEPIFSELRNRFPDAIFLDGVFVKKQKFSFAEEDDKEGLYNKIIENEVDYIIINKAQLKLEEAKLIDFKNKVKILIVDDIVSSEWTAKLCAYLIEKHLSKVIIDKVNEVCVISVLKIDSDRSNAKMEIPNYCGVKNGSSF